MIILKCNIALDGESFENLYKAIDRMKQNGLIILPSYMEVIQIPDKEKVDIICEDGLGEPPAALIRMCADCKYYYEERSFETLDHDWKLRQICMNKYSNDKEIKASNLGCRHFEEKEK